jgi:chromosomal replication initiator protein
LQKAPPDDAAKVWGDIREDLRDSLPQSTFSIWIEPLKAAGVSGDVLRLTAPEAIRAWVERRYAKAIADSAGRWYPALREVLFCEQGGQTAAGSAGESSASSAYTFDRFVIGGGNRLAHAAALSVAEAPGEAYNPLFLHGPPGLGKTHLLGAIAGYVRRQRPGLTVCHTTAEKFTAEFVAALNTTGIESFKSRYRRFDLLLIDDVQFLEGKERTAEEFFHTFNDLHDSGAQIVLSSDRPAGELSRLAERLRDRFEWGLTVSLQAPDQPTRLTVLRLLAQEQGLPVTPAVLAAIAEQAPANIRQLEGALTTAVAQASLTREALDETLVRRLPTERRNGVPPAAVDIQAAVAQHAGLNAEQLRGPQRSSHIVRARQIAMYLCRELTSSSLPAIARTFSRDHTTVLHAHRRIAAAIATEPETRATVDELHSQLTGQRQSNQPSL